MSDIPHQASLEIDSVIVGTCYSCICYPSWNIITRMWCSIKMVHPLHSPRILREFLDGIFLGAGLGFTDQFRGRRAHPILRRLVPSFEDTLRTLFTRPCDLLDELKIRIVAAIETVTTQILENNLRGIEHRLDILRVTRACMLKLFSILQH
jgi:hypothetical protein